MMKIAKTFQALIAGVLAVQLAGCGTLMHPERKGQQGGRLDAGIVILDALGLLFFIIPGVIAFAVDFSNGTIYLPPGATGSLGRKEIQVARFDPKHATAATIEEIIYKETGRRVKLNQKGVEVSRLESLEEVKERIDKMYRI